MFEPEKVKTLSDLELIVYNYVISHLKEVQHLTIRELAEACHVSSSTILRGCVKLGLNGFSELKFVVRKALENQKNQTVEQFYDATIQVDMFLKKVNNESYRKVIEPAVELILAARHVAFSGTGTSGILGMYGSRYFANLGLNAYNITDPFAPIPSRGLESTLAIILSASGENKEMIVQMESFKQYGAKVLSITNDEQSTIARVADYNLSYFMPEMLRGKEHIVNLTTQVPVVALIEILAQQAAKEM